MSFDPPPGYADFFGDAELFPGDDRYGYVDVPRVGGLRFRHLTPASGVHLVRAASGRFNDTARSDAMMALVSSHVPEEELGRIAEAMMDGAGVEDSTLRIARAITTWGTARPYAAVVTLTVLLAHHWRSVRHKLLMAGLGHPMQLPTLHTLLDIAEDMAVSSATNKVIAARSDPDLEMDAAIDSLYFTLYGPTRDNVALNGEETVPEGFDADSVEDSFDAFARAAANSS